MDQASLLREMMKGMQQEKCDSVAILSTSDVDDASEFAKLFSDILSKKIQKDITLLGIEEGGLSVKDMLLNDMNIEQIKERIHSRVHQISGSLEFISKIRKDKKLIEKFIEDLKEIEKKSGMILYYAGEGIEPTTINLSNASNKILIIMKSTEKSFMEICNYIKILTKINAEKTVGVVIDTSDEGIFKEQFGKLQEYCWSEFNYKIEPIGFFETKYLSLFEDSRIFEGFDLNHLTNKRGIKTFSDSIYKMTM